MALMPQNLADSISQCLGFERNYRYEHSGLRFLAKNSGFASALRQKLLTGGLDACRRREKQPTLWPAKNANKGTNQSLMRNQIMPKYNRT